MFVRRDPGGVDTVLGDQYLKIPFLEETAENLAVDTIVVDDQDLVRCFDGSALYRSA